MARAAYYAEFEALSCARHAEAKALANKLWRKWSAIIDKKVEEIHRPEPDLGRIEKLAENAENVLSEFNNLRRGLTRCCAAR